MSRRLAALLAAGCVALAACSGTAPQPTMSPSPTAAPSTAVSTSPSASASASPSPTPSGAHVGEQIPATITGLHIAGVQDGQWPDSNLPFGALRLWDNGTNWSQVEAVKGKYDWTALDNAVANARLHRVDDILLVLGSTPTWNASRVRRGDYPVPGAASMPRSVGAWESFVTAVATRYRGRITAYQIWNEASLTIFWNGTPAQLADLTKRAYDIIRKVDPQAKVVAASTTVRLTGAFERFFPAYLDELKALDWPVDVFAAHLYPPSRLTSDARAAYIGQVQSALTAAGSPDLPLWDTELNYGLAGPGPSNPLKPIEGENARDWVVMTALDSLYLGVLRTYWYIWTPKPYPLLGLQLTNDSGAARGLRVVDNWVVGATFEGCTNDGAVVACHLNKSGAESVIAWAVDESATYTPPPSLTQACTTANDCTEVPGAYALGQTPVRFTA